MKSSLKEVSKAEYLFTYKSFVVGMYHLNVTRSNVSVASGKLICWWCLERKFYEIQKRSQSFSTHLCVLLAAFDIFGPIADIFVGIED